jgi:outer membrane biosynthesis protein TonB
VNKFRPSERLSGLLAFALSALFYSSIAALVFVWMRSHPVEQAAFTPAPVHLNFAQIKLEAAESPPEMKPEPPPPEKAEAAVEPKPEETPPEPVKADLAHRSEMEVTAQVTQEASAPAVLPVDRNVLLNWVREQIEKEKYYPPAARNAGLEATFTLLVKISADGAISSAEITGGKGSFLLRNALNNMLIKLPGRKFGQPLPVAMELPFEFEFDLNPSFQSWEKTPEQVPDSGKQKPILSKLWNWVRGK